MKNSVAVAIGAVLLATIVVEPVIAAETEATQWSDERGTAAAERLIQSCLKSHPAGREGHFGCVKAAFEPCTNEIDGGRMSQFDLNACRRFSYRAWHERYDMMLAQFEEVLMMWRQPSGDGWKKSTAARFQAQEEAWRRWFAADCEMWELGSVGGSIHGYAVATCEERHIALRTIELAPLLEYLGSR
jgi:uncharacterized protein YecT (DUF1311 family)